jgi:hypothetical protein
MISSESTSSTSPAQPPDTVSLEDARRAEPIVREPDDLAVLEAKNQHEQTLKKAEQGWLGGLLGSHGEKAGNISFIVILICFALISLAFFRMDLKSEFDSFMKFAGAMFAIITGALGYLFGSSGGKSNK